ncbi:MAG: IclR family transcriptional regulator [Pseudomonadota bacterium]
MSSTLTNGLGILGCFQTGAEILTNAEIAHRLGLNKATVSRLCKTLVTQNYLRRDPFGGFRLDPKILSLSYPVLSSMSWRQRAIGVMVEVAEMANGNVSMSVLAGCDTVFIQTAGTPRDFPHVPEIGMTTPMPTSSPGRALLAMLSDEERAQKFAELRRVYPEHLEAHSKAIEEAIESCNQRGFCISFGDWRRTVFGISSPFARTPDGLCVVMTCGIPAFRTSRDEVENHLAPRLASSVETLRQMDIL